MKFIRFEIPDVVMIEPAVHKDSRGIFLEAYREDLFHANGIREGFVQDNQSRSAKGVLRGLHYQVPPRAQAKLIRVTRGEIFDVALDIRRSSPTFGKSVSAVLNEENQKTLYIPAGFAHGFCALRDGTEVIYKVSDFYSPDHDRGILWSDPALGISWPRLDRPYALSEKDKRHPPFKQAEVF